MAQAAPGGSASRGFSLIQDCGYYNTSCGYCREGESSTSTGMHAHRLTVYDYQELLDQGWRRSGKFLYQPDNKVTCCRQYAIRLDVTDFQPSKAHRKLLRKWEQYLAGHLPHEHSAQHQGAEQGNSTQQTHNTKASTSTAAGTAATHGSHAQSRDTASPKRARTSPALAHQQPVHHAEQQQQQPRCPDVQLLEQVKALLHTAVRQLQEASAVSVDLDTQLLPAVKVLPAPQHHPQGSSKHKHSWPPGTLMTSPCAHALAAVVRKQQQTRQSPAPSLQASGSGDSSSCLWVQPEQLAVSLAERFNSLGASLQPPVDLVAAASKGHINFIQQQSPQGVQAGAQQPQPPPQQEQKQQVPAGARQAHRHNHSNPQQQPRTLEVRMVPNHFIQEEFELWQRYQAQQHHEAPESLTRNHYKGFLVDTPLVHVPPPAAPAAAQQQQQQSEGPAAADAARSMPSCGYGSFHQQYWLDGKLVAVGVVDVLPRCLSSKYFFWDPDYAWLSLGRYGALREISWVAEQHAAGAADLRYYYLGYYIHTCPKMAYKAEYPPSELLCPKRQVWVRIDDTLLRALDRSPYVVLSDLPGVQMKPNLSVPRQPPQAPAQGANGSSTFGQLGSTGTLEHLSREQQIQKRQRERQALDAQLLFVMKQPVRWGALRDSGMLDDGGISDMEERLTAWRAAVGETARSLLYAAAQDML